MELIWKLTLYDISKYRGLFRFIYGMQEEDLKLRD